MIFLSFLFYFIFFVGRNSSKWGQKDWWAHCWGNGGSWKRGILYRLCKLLIFCNSYLFICLFDFFPPNFDFSWCQSGLACTLLLPFFPFHMLIKFVAHILFSIFWYFDGIEWNLEKEWNISWKKTINMWKLEKQERENDIGSIFLLNKKNYENVF